jgi:TPR repeat protein
MTHFGMILLIACCVWGSRPEAAAQLVQPLDPHAAQQYKSDAEKADSGDAEAAYRMGEALESGRLGGVVDSNKALNFYRQAAEQGHPEAAARVAEIEAKLGRKEEKLQASPPSAVH